ncbi:hypothetical protein [Blastococcus haudaquaticus]|uniref:Tetratricopeptide repeat-containing protein n=1 Tax=Blastococcus haudaquaticus TaxID=1938745 RepID=A0A286GT55_9ACTN|nr:hypothetical protein [Blastococcus haudaquaticus]SOD98632.1 hypothetical protein SAMN06272739_1978 [Blastococcus haudaquaticus]
MSATDPTMADIAAAVQVGRDGRRAESREQLDALWERLGPDGDPLCRVTLAHFLADLQDDPREELAWDERALEAVGDLTDRRAGQEHAGVQARGFLPSLHLNLADVHRRLGNPAAAREHLAAAEAKAPDLPSGDYADLIRSGLEHVRAALDAGSTERLATAP